MMCNSTSSSGCEYLDMLKGLGFESLMPLIIIYVFWQSMDLILRLGIGQREGECAL